MQELVKVVVDAMGGVQRAAGNGERRCRCGEHPGRTSGDPDEWQELVEGELSKYTYPKDRIEVVNTTEVIEMAEPPVNAIRKKKDSSIVVGMNLVKKARQTLSYHWKYRSCSGRRTVIVGRIKGVERPYLPADPHGWVALLIDCGANVDARPSHLVQFAKMGSFIWKMWSG